jgi:hypothetical protein
MAHRVDLEVAGRISLGAQRRRETQKPQCRGDSPHGRDAHQWPAFVLARVQRTSEGDIETRLTAGRGSKVRVATLIVVKKPVWKRDGGGHRRPLP